jgi:hypothetical protein
MSTLVLLSIHALRTAKKKRRGVCHHRVEALRFLLESGEYIPPIRVNKLEDGTYTIKDGRHRVAAHRRAGMTQIWAIVENVMRPLQPLRALCSTPTSVGLLFVFK